MNTINDQQILADTLEKAIEVIIELGNLNIEYSIPTPKNEIEQRVFGALSSLKGNMENLTGEIYSSSKSLKKSADSLTNFSEKMMNRAESMKLRASKVSDATNNMSDNMNSVSAAAEELSTNMKTVSESANSSSSNVNNVSAAVEEMTSTISEIANHSEQALNVVLNAVESVKNATKNMQELNVASQDIEHVTSSISGISDQTKILAINATIEAGRAGSEGIRFGVVANEVKALASQTDTATADIQNKVKAMQESTKLVLNEINSINTVMEDVQQIVATIATAVEEQSATTKEIASNITYAADGIADMSNTVEEAAIAVQEVTKNITEAASLARDVSVSIDEVSNNTIEMDQESILLYANAMEVDSRTEDLGFMIDKVNLTSKVKRMPQTNELFKFSEAYSVKVIDMNDEHKGIFDRINKIYNGIKDSKSAYQLLAPLKDLYEWTVDHFAHEERLMKSINYADFDKQIRAHENLLSNVAKNIENIENGEKVNMIKLMVFLKDWLVGHIQGMDKKYSKPMNDNGIE